MINYSDISTRLKNIEEFYAAGFIEKQNASIFERFSSGIRRYLENCNMPDYNGALLYPCGQFSSKSCFTHNYSFTFACNWKRLEQKDKEAANILREIIPEYKSVLPQEHTVGGAMYTHSIPNFRRIVREGLASYQKRVESIKSSDIRLGLLDVLSGIRAFHTRCLDVVKNIPEAHSLYKALKKVPFEPAETLYEAIVSWNFVYYMDGCDNIGRLDADLIDFYKGEDMTDVFRCLFCNVDSNDGWSGALGPEYNALTLQCLKAVRGLRRPSLELRVTPDMPQMVWDAACDAVYDGSGNPSFYNEEAYQNVLHKLFPDIPHEDLMRFCGGGCTETMLAGINNVGSLDAGINIALIFEKVMTDHLVNSKCFDSFYNIFIKECHEVTYKVLYSVSKNQEIRSKNRPNPMRTLLIDDCIDKEKDFNNGGTRYTWSVINLAGLINVLDSLLVIRQLIYIDKVMTGKELLQRLQTGDTLKTYSNIPRHGDDSEEARAMANRLITDICSAFEKKIPYSGGKFLPSSIQFTTYEDAGKRVGATPDGRIAGAPLCDSIGAIHGNDKFGVTAMLNSACSLAQENMAGTPVLNIKLDANQTEKTLQYLVKGYFQNGGMQLQVTCIRKEDLLAAHNCPEKYPNLIVRIGGYSEYFQRLSPELRQTVIERTLY